MNISNKLYHSIAVAIGSSYVFYAINFSGQLLLARLLSPEDFGVMALVLAVMGMVDLIVGFSIPMAYIQKKETATLFESASTLSLIVGALPVIISVVLYYPLSIYYNEKVALYTFIISLSKPFYAMGNIVIAKMEKNLKFGKSYILRGVALSISLVIAVLMAYFGYEEKSLIARELLSGIFLYVIARYYLGSNISLVYKLEELKDLLAYSLKMLFSRAAELIYFKVPILVIASLYGTVTLGYFSQAFYLASLASTALNPITEKVAFVFYSHSNNDGKNNRKDFRVIALASLVVALPISFILFVFPKEILSFLYGEKWLGSSLYLQYLACFGLLLPLFNNLKSYFYSLGKNSFVAFSYMVGFIVSILFISLGRVEFAFGVSILISLVVLYAKK
jgi:O-antigen/teichoic acid export membrane protein